MSHVRKLATDIGVRVRSTSGERRGARYIKKRFRHLGYKVNVQKFDVDGGTSRNVVAWWPGATKFPVVIGGHMDSVPASPGANDNASGVAVVLELARIFADRRPSRYVKWIAFGSEEYGADGRHHVGSQVYVNRLSDKGRRRMAGMISVDMIADGRPLIVGTAGIGPEIVARTLLRRLGKAGIKGEYRTTCDCSDNGPFERAGIPAAFAWSGDEPNYHLPSDTVQNMAPRDLLRTGRAVRAFVRGLDRALIQRFRSK
jgi:Zn-dependent M28 family amino/carboxypeptidase